MYPNLYLFFAARFFQGACIGLYSAIIPLLIKEYSPVEISGTFGALNQTFIAFGVFFAFAFQLILVQINSELEHWRIIYGFTLITIVIQTLLLLFIYK
jgi:MFS family permease